METIKKPRIEDIFPLSYMQQGLLFHHLSSPWDQGFLNVECTLTGDLDPSIFEASCQFLAQRHAILRTSVLWDKLEKPLQIVHQEKTLDIDFLDWTDFSNEKKEENWDRLKVKYRDLGPQFGEGALSRMTLVTFKKNTYRLLWPSHHLLVDGWSSSLILKDLLTFYDALYRNENPVLDTLPSHRAYLNWINKIPLGEASGFWSDYFKGLERVALFEGGMGITDVSKPTIKGMGLSAEDTNLLSAVAKAYQVTVNTMVQGAWSLVLSRYFGREDITYGATVSGRSGDFPNMHLLTGMFTNIQPIRNVAVDGLLFSDWFNGIQERQQRARRYEHMSLDQITSFIDWPSARPLFDSLLIFENYPKTDTADGVLKVSGFESGLTSTFPITIAVVPGQEMEFVLSVLPETISKKAASWILERLIEILQLLASEKIQTFSDLRALVPVFEGTDDALAKSPPKLAGQAPYNAPTNTVEQSLVEIWENLFGIDAIGIDDDFFAIGGKSLLAVKMFSTINKELDTKLPPTTLLQHPTIKAIAATIGSTGTQVGTADNFKNLVKIQPKGQRAPLFCLHAGGGHVFFYNPLARYMKAIRPIYAVRPSGLYENEEMHGTIEEMARDYVKEIRQSHPSGPYNLLVYCFSTAVGFEMANLLKEMDQEVNLIVMDTMAQQEQLTRDRFAMRILGFAKRFVGNPFKVIRIAVEDRVDRHLKPLWVDLTGTRAERNTSNTVQHLVKIYNKYQWKPYEVEVTLVLTKKATALFNKELLSSWEKISTKVTVLHTGGDHRTLFEEPDVKFVAKTLDSYLQ